MPAYDDNERAIRAVQQRTPNGQNFRVVDIQQKFMRGRLYTVAFEITAGNDGAISTLNNRVYIKRDDVRVYANDDLLIASIGSEDVGGLLAWISRTTIVPGLIAVILTVTICYLTIYQNSLKVPEILSNALSIILGYYFARATDRQSGE